MSGVTARPPIAAVGRAAASHPTPVDRRAEGDNGYRVISEIRTIFASPAMAKHPSR